MKAMILAAGRGERMKPLTDHCPKPLLKVAGHSLIEHHLIKLARLGIKQVVINHAWLGQQIEERLGSGARYQVEIIYSREVDGALETAGGIVNALPLLQTHASDDDCFLVVNGDIYCDYNFDHLPSLAPTKTAHLVLVDNPAHHPKGDFALTHGIVRLQNEKKLTYSGIGLYRPSFFKGLPVAKHALGPMLKNAIAKNQVSGEHFHGCWTDVGTPERLTALNVQLQKNNSSTN